MNIQTNMNMLERVISAKYTIIAITAISINIAMVMISMLPLSHVTIAEIPTQGVVDCNILSKLINQDMSNTTDTPEKRVNDLAAYISNCQ
jgi:hypothetical protein